MSAPAPPTDAAAHAAPRAPEAAPGRAPSLLVVIVNYASGGLVADCLASLAAERPAAHGWRVVVTDNGSPDDSAARIEGVIAERGYGAWCQLQRLPRNGGFAYGNNAAIRPALAAAAPPDFVLLLNPDTVVRPGAIDALLTFMVSHAAVGIAGSRLEDPDGTVQRSAFRFHGVASEFEHAMRLGPVSRCLARHVVAPPAPADAAPADWVAGASMMIRRAVFEAVGLLDERYFMYFEEVDFCRRAQRAGWPTWYVPASRVVHLVGQTSGVTDTKRPRKRRPAYWFESRRLYFVTHLGGGRAALADALWLAGYALYRLRAAVTGREVSDPPRLWWDFLRHSTLVRAWAPRRRQAPACAGGAVS